MIRNTYRVREFRCLDCEARFYRGFWAKRDRDFPTLGSIVCPTCTSRRNERLLEQFYRQAGHGPVLRAGSRPVVYRKIGADGKEQIRYPPTNDPSISPPREGEERVEFDTLAQLEAFCKQQNPNHQQWQVPLNDVLDYDNPDTAIDEYDPGVRQDVDDIMGVDDAGTLDGPPAEGVVKGYYEDR